MQTDVKTYDEMLRMSRQSTGGCAHEHKRSCGNSMWWHGRRGNSTIRTLLIVAYMVFSLPALSARILHPPSVVGVRARFAVFSVLSVTVNSLDICRHIPFRAPRLHRLVFRSRHKRAL